MRWIHDQELIRQNLIFAGTLMCWISFGRPWLTSLTTFGTRAFPCCRSKLKATFFIMSCTIMPLFSSDTDRVADCGPDFFMVLSIQTKTFNSRTCWWLTSMNCLQVLTVRCHRPRPFVWNLQHWHWHLQVPWVRSKISQLTRSQSPLFPKSSGIVNRFSFQVYSVNLFFSFLSPQHRCVVGCFKGSWMKVCGRLELGCEGLESLKTLKGPEELWRVREELPGSSGTNRRYHLSWLWLRELWKIDASDCFRTPVPYPWGAERQWQFAIGGLYGSLLWTGGL